MASVASRRWENPQWIADHVAEQLPPGIATLARVFPERDVVEVSLSAPRWMFPLPSQRRRLLVRAVMATADSPAGVAVRTRWQR